MARRYKFKLTAVVLHTTLIAGIIWQALAFSRTVFPALNISQVDTHKVMVSGNVRRPGVYKVPHGTTEFELLHAAGIRNNSDLASFSLVSRVSENGILQVNALEAPVGLRNEPVVRVEFFLGEITLVSRDGRVLPQAEGVMLSEGDRVQTEAASQAELSIGTEARVNLDNFSEVVIDKIAVGDGDRPQIELFQRSGLCWYKIALTEKRESYVITTPFAELTVGGTGADFFVSIRGDHLVINNMDGLIYLERLDGSEAINIISGQMVTIYEDGRPFQITGIRGEDDVSGRFTPIEEERRRYMTRNMPLNVLFCGLPHTFFMISTQFETGTVNVVPIPPSLIVEQFVHGFSTLDEAFLYGGPMLVSILIEKVLNIQIPKYVVMNRSDIMRTAAALGGLEVYLDPVAASELNLPSGESKLNQEQLALFVSPEISGYEDSKRRQIAVFRNLFEGLRKENIVITALLADQLITNIETNFIPSDIMNQYSRFRERPAWAFLHHDLPVTSIQRRNKTCYEPQLELSRNLF